MGIEASYRRITAAEWDRLQRIVESGEASDGWGEAFDAYVEVADSDELRSGDRYLSIEKDWHALHVFLTGDLSSPSDIPPYPPPQGNVVMGGTETPFDATYGKVRYLTPDEVREVADVLGGTSVDDLRARFDPVAFTRAEIYPNPRPGGWDSDELESLMNIYPALVDFFQAAARDRNVVLLSFE